MKDLAWSIDVEDEEDHDSGIRDNTFIDDDVDENMIENDNDDDDDIINPFNTVSKPDDDTDVEFNEEEDID
jgi:hypothetical protein